MTLKTGEDFRLLRLLLDSDPNPTGLSLLEVVDFVIKTEEDQMKLLEWMERTGERAPDAVIEKAILIRYKGNPPKPV